MMVPESVATYLLRELFWELDQFEGIGSELQPREEVQVASCMGYHDLIVRVGARTYEVWLSWRADMPPRITPRGT